MTTAGAGQAKSTMTATAAFTVGNALPRVLNLLLLPLYTAVLSPAEYGQLALLLALGVAFSFLFGLGFDTAVYRGFYRTGVGASEQANYVNSLWFTLLGTVPLLAVLVACVGSAVVTGSSWFSVTSFSLAVVAYAAYALALPLPLAVLRAQRRLRGFLALSIGGGLITSGLTLMAVVGLDQGVNGWLAATLLGNVACLIIAAFVLPLGRPKPMAKVDVKAALRLGVPLIPNYLAHWGLQLADRAVLAGLTTIASVGIYSLAGNIAVAALVVVQGLTQALMPLYGQVAAQEGRGVSDVITTQVLAVLGLSAALAVIAPAAAAAVTPAEYDGAISVIPWLILGYTFLGLYYAPMNILTLVVGDSRLVAVLTAGSVIANLTLLYVLVPRWGIEGAGMASATAYATLFVATAAYARVAYYKRGFAPITLPYSRLSVGLTCSIAFYAVGSRVDVESEWGTLGLRCVAVALTLIVGYCLWNRSRKTVA